MIENTEILRQFYQIDRIPVQAGLANQRYHSADRNHDTRVRVRICNKLRKFPARETRKFERSSYTIWF